MKIDRKKEFKKKLITCCSLLTVVDPLKIIVDETFLSLCINHQISIKEELNKLINRQIIIMTTKCITTNAKQLNDETAYALRKLTHYKCNHEQDNLKHSINYFLNKMSKSENSKFSSNNYFENQIRVTHNFDSLYNIKSGINANNIINDNTKQSREGTIKISENDTSNEKDNKSYEKDILPNEEKIKTDENNELSNSMKCIIDLIKNNNEKKFFIATNNMELRYFLRRIFLVPIIYVSEGGALKIESISTKNKNKKKIFEIKKMKIPKWERDIKRSEQKRNKNAKKSIKKKKKKKKKIDKIEVNENKMGTEKDLNKT